MVFLFGFVLGLIVWGLFLDWVFGVCFLFSFWLLVGVFYLGFCWVCGWGLC